MTAFDFSDLDFAVRSDIPEAYTAYWEALAAPGNWWTGAESGGGADGTGGALDGGCARRAPNGTSEKIVCSASWR